KNLRNALTVGEGPVLRWDILGVRRYTHRLVKYLVAEHTSAGKLGLASFFGILIGTSPFFGLHLFLCLFVAMAFRLNKVAVYAVANVSIPPLAPFIMFANYQVGYLLA